MDVALWIVVIAAIGVLIFVSIRLRRAEALYRLAADEYAYSVDQRLPALVESLQGAAVEVPGLRHAELADTAPARHLQAIVDLFAEYATQEAARADRAAKDTLASTMRGVQNLANEQQLLITEMQHRHDDPDVLAGLLEIDHANSQLARRAQATAVLCGSWPGQQRAASELLDVVRGATSRIRDYTRIDTQFPLGETGVVSRAVEPVVLAVAELLDNAARYSQPTTQVEVHFRHAYNGVSIVIDDAGVGMSGDERERAKTLLSSSETIDINRLGDPPQVGFVLAGVLAARYGFQVFVEAFSPYGGTRAVVYLPNQLLTQIDDKTVGHTARQPAATPEPRQAPERSAQALLTREESPAARTTKGLIATEPAEQEPAEQEPAEEESTVEHTANGLPKRRRKEPAAVAESAVRSTGQSAEQRWGAGRVKGMGAWQRGTRSGRAEGKHAEGKHAEGKHAEGNNPINPEGTPANEQL